MADGNEILNDVVRVMLMVLLSTHNINESVGIFLDGCPSNNPPLLHNAIMEAYPTWLVPGIKYPSNSVVQNSTSWCSCTCDIVRLHFLFDTDMAILG